MRPGLPLESGSGLWIQRGTRAGLHLLCDAEHGHWSMLLATSKRREVVLPELDTQS